MIAILDVVITTGGYSCLGVFFQEESVMQIPCICAGVISLVAGLFLLIGSIGYNKITCLVYLVLKMIHIVVTMVVTIQLALCFFGILGPDYDSIEGIGFAYVSIIYFLIYLLCTPINIYFWVCVFSFYKGLINEEIIFPA